MTMQTIPEAAAPAVDTKPASQHSVSRMSEPSSEPLALPDIEKLPLFARNVAAWFGLGYSLRQISTQAGVTPQALSVMLVRLRAELRAATNRPGELAGLSPRAVNALGVLGITSRAAARRIKSLEKELMAQRNCGRKTVREILDWVNLSDSST